MSEAATVELIKQGGALLNSAIFVGAGLYLILRFRGAFGDFFRRLSEFSLKTPAGEFSAKAAAEAGALLGAAQAAEREARAPDEPAPEPVAPEALAESVRAAAEAGPRLRSRHILWVDDHPKNNELIAGAIAAVGVRIDTATSTEEALRRLQAGRYDLIITDMTRGRDGDAGLKFIEQVKAMNRRAKIIVYASRKAAHKYPRAYELGAVGATADPADLFNRVMAQLG